MGDAVLRIAGYIILACLGGATAGAMTAGLWWTLPVWVFLAVCVIEAMRDA